MSDNFNNLELMLAAFLSGAGEAAYDLENGIEENTPTFDEWWSEPPMDYDMRALFHLCERAVKNRDFARLKPDEQSDIRRVTEIGDRFCAA